MCAEGKKKSRPLYVARSLLWQQIYSIAAATAYRNVRLPFASRPIRVEKECVCQPVSPLLLAKRRIKRTFFFVIKIYIFTRTKIKPQNAIYIDVVKGNSFDFIFFLVQLPGRVRVGRVRAPELCPDAARNVSGQQIHHTAHRIDGEQGMGG